MNSNSTRASDIQVMDISYSHFDMTEELDAEFVVTIKCKLDFLTK